MSRIVKSDPAPELSTCVCGEIPSLVRRQEGMVYAWRVECNYCRLKTFPTVGRIQAATKWEKLIREMINDD